MSFPIKSREPLVVVSVNDPAVARSTVPDQIALKRYSEDRDMSKLRLIEGAAPAQFVMKPLPGSLRLLCESFASESTRHLMAFACSLMRIDDPNLRWEPKEKAIQWDGEEFTIVDPKSVSQLDEMIGGKVVEEIGSVALQRANMTANQKKAYWLPRGCAVDLAIASPATAAAPSSDEVSGSN